MISASLLLPALLLLSLGILYRGHNLPGGGFIGGLLGATAFALAALGSGAATVRRAIRLQPRTLTAVGLALAMAAGLLGLAAGEPFLTAQWTSVGGVELGTPLLFDLGVFILVVGAVLTVLFTLDEEAC